MLLYNRIILQKYESVLASGCEVLNAYKNFDIKLLSECDLIFYP